MNNGGIKNRFLNLDANQSMQTLYWCKREEIMKRIKRRIFRVNGAQKKKKYGQKRMTWYEDKIKEDRKGMSKR